MKHEEKLRLPWPPMVESSENIFVLLGQCRIQGRHGGIPQQEMKNVKRKMQPWQKEKCEKKSLKICNYFPFNQQNVLLRH